MASYPAVFVDENGETRLAGMLTFTDPGNQPGTFNGGTITRPLVIDVSGDLTGNSLPLQLRASWNAQAVDFFSVYNTDTGVDAVAIDSGTNVLVNNHTTGASVATIGGLGDILTKHGFDTQVITSGALPTQAFVSGTAVQLGSRDVTLVVPFTGDATNNAATLKIELSPDNLTFSTLDTLSIAAALNLTGAINVPVTVFVPQTWFVKLTATHGTIGTGTYY